VAGSNPSFRNLRQAKRNHDAQRRCLNHAKARHFGANSFGKCVSAIARHKA